MSSAVGPGDWVECIDPRAPAWALGRPFRVVELVLEDERCFMCGDAGPGVELDDERCRLDVYCTGCQVRPIYSPKSDLIETLKQPAPDAVRELEEVA